jgi:hypothetical protein
MSSSLLLHPAQTRIAYDLFEPGGAARLRVSAQNGLALARVCPRRLGYACLLIAALAKETQRVQQLLVFVQETTNGQADVLGFLTCALVP